MAKNDHKMVKNHWKMQQKQKNKNSSGSNLIKLLWSKFAHSFCKLNRFVSVNYFSRGTKMVLLTKKQKIHSKISLQDCLQQGRLTEGEGSIQLNSLII
jgi:hypothetical protein